MTHLEKAKGALAEARDADDIALDDLLRIASVQANVAQAEALQRIADSLDRLVNTQGRLKVDVVS